MDVLRIINWGIAIYIIGAISMFLLLTMSVKFKWYDPDQEAQVHNATPAAIWHISTMWFVVVFSAVKAVIINIRERRTEK